METQVFADDLMPVGREAEAGVEDDLFGGEEEEGEQERHFVVR
jgi:hypothetical protein